MDRLRRAAELHGHAAAMDEDPGAVVKKNWRMITQHPRWCAQYMASILASSR